MTNELGRLGDYCYRLIIRTDQPGARLCPRSTFPGGLGGSGGCCRQFLQSLASQFTNLIDTPSLQLIVAWAVLFVATLLVGMLLTYVIGQLVKATGLSGTDRLIGSLFGIARGLVLVLVILVLVPKALPVDEDPWWQQSQLIPQFLKFEQWASDMGGSLYESGKQLLNSDSNSNPNSNPEQQIQFSIPGS